MRMIGSPTSILCCDWQRSFSAKFICISATGQEPYCRPQYMQIINYATVYYLTKKYI